MDSSFVFSYLGVYLTSAGRIFKSPPVGDERAVEAVEATSEVLISENKLLTKYHHSFVLGDVYDNHLTMLYLKVGRYVRDLLHLPQDPPSSAVTLQ